MVWVLLHLKNWKNYTGNSNSSFQLINIQSDHMKTKFPIIPFAAVSLLPIPFIAMQFTKEVNWSASDFIIMGVLLLLVGSGIEVVRRKNKKSTRRLIYIAMIVISFLLIWLELAVGIFGTPFAGK